MFQFPRETHGISKDENKRTKITFKFPRACILLENFVSFLKKRDMMTMFSSYGRIIDKALPTNLTSQKSSKLREISFSVIVWLKSTIFSKSIFSEKDSQT